MRKYFSITLWAPLIFFIFCTILFMRVYLFEMVDFEQYVLKKQINYATDSAVQAMLVDSNVDADYVNGTSIAVDPDLAVSDLAHTMAIDFGYLPTDKALYKVLNDQFRCIVIAARDGYYVVSEQQTDNRGGYEMVLSPKLPYLLSYGDKQYCLTLNPDKGYYAYRDGTDYKLMNFDTYPTSVKPPVTIQAQKIISLLSDATNYAASLKTSDGKDKYLKLPDISSSLNELRTIDSPAIIAIVDGTRKLNQTAITADSVASSRIVVADFCVCYDIEAGAKVQYGGAWVALPPGKHYAYASWWAAHPVQDSGKLTNSKTFATPYEAAANGYNSLNMMYETK